ncbi:MAG: hypothetical protein JST63_01030 [Bacteroidetes bacterium]|nr:hypothetical protein [Bacteroidota bacterium]
MFRAYLFIVLILFAGTASSSAQDTIPTPSSSKDSLKTNSTIASSVSKVVDSAGKKLLEDTASHKWSPARKAAILSAILPGAGQAYNRKYWKMPIVYAALAIPVYTFTDNLKWFQRTRYAYNILARKDSANFKNVYPQLQPFVEAGDLSGLQKYRGEFRKNVDYSVLAFLILWGLNVVDAAVDGHLKNFNVTDDLSLQFKPGFSQMANTAGISLVLNIGKNASPHTNSAH